MPPVMHCFSFRIMKTKNQAKTRLLRARPNKKTGRFSGAVETRHALSLPFYILSLPFYILSLPFYLISIFMCHASAITYLISVIICLVSEIYFLSLYKAMSVSYTHLRAHETRHDLV